MATSELHLVEDSPADVELVQEALEDLRYELTLSVSRNGEEFMNYWKALRSEDRTREFPELVLLDIDLPRKNGFEVLEELNESAASNEVPLVVLTMSNATEDIRRCYERGANACLTKPLGFGAFRALLDSALDFWVVG